MSYPVLGRRDEALTEAETEQFLRQRIGGELLATSDDFGTFTVTVTPAAWVDTLTLCRDEDLLAYDMFDCLFGVDRGDDGFDVVAIVYSTSRGRRLTLKARCEGGREAPTFPTAVGVFAGADWMERETWDMFGIEFEGHPGLAPRILCIENFEGWPLRKDFYLASRSVKPWPGVKEPAETDEDGNVIVKVPGPGDAPGPAVLDEILAIQARAANPQPEVEAEAAPAAAPEADAADAPAETPADDATAEKADEARQAQADARAEAAAAQADAEPVAAEDDGPVIPEGVAPDDDEEGSA